MSAVVTRWYWMNEGRQAGPVTWAELQMLAVSGGLKPDDMVLREGSRNWQPARTARETADASNSCSVPQPAAARGAAATCVTGFASEEIDDLDAGQGGFKPGRMLFGAILFAGGIIGSWASMNAARERGGGTCVIFTGPIIFGLFLFLNSFGSRARSQ